MGDSHDDLVFRACLEIAEHEMAHESNRITKKQRKHTGSIDLRSALKLAFEAGCNFGIASHKDFVQIHEPCDIVVDALAQRVIMPTRT